MKIVLAIIFAMACLEPACASLEFSSCEQDKDPVICDLEKSVAQQERLLNSLRAKYAKLLNQKKQLLDWIEQEKQRLEQKQTGPVQQKVVKNQERFNSLSEKETELIFESEKRNPEGRDINYLSILINKQKELCAAIIQLEINIAAEEKSLKQLKEKSEDIAKSF
jgi:predicted  nucleic acid-binding Zn-ribbon protein